MGRLQSIVDSTIGSAIFYFILLLGALVFASIASWWRGSTELEQGVFYALAAICFLGIIGFAALRASPARRPLVTKEGNEPGFLPITVADIDRVIHQALPANQDQTRRQFVAATVRWRGYLSDVSQRGADGKCRLYLWETKRRWWNRSGYIRPSFTATVDSFPGLAVLEKEAEMVIEGTIQGFTLLSPHLEPAKVIRYGGR